MNTTENKRGGRRPGAGRPTLEPKDRRVSISISVDPEVKAMAAELRKAGVHLGPLFDLFIAKAYAWRFNAETQYHPRGDGSIDICITRK